MRDITRASFEELDRIIKTEDRNSSQFKEAHKELERRAMTDNLTGIYNRWGWTEKFLNELKIADEKGVNLGCLLMDLDNFGPVNKKYGHDFGDRLLNAAARCIKKNTRSYEIREGEGENQKIRRRDIIGRYGGEEFIFFGETGFDRLKVLGGRIRNLVEAATMGAAIIESPYLPEDGNYEDITISIGGALYRGESGKSGNFYSQEFSREKIGEHPLIMKADEALKIAKKEGKNRVILLEEII